jgi:hypothetical protein
MRRTPAAVAPIAAPAVAPVVSWRTESVCKMGDMVVVKAKRNCLVFCRGELQTFVDNYGFVKIVEGEARGSGRWALLPTRLTNRENGLVS